MQACNVLVGGLILATLLHASVMPKSMQEKADEELTGTNSMTFLGSVDGKYFFYEPHPYRTWFDARDTCNASSMQLASITSENQAKFLNEINNMENYTNHGFWTAGRDSQTLSQFLWDGDNSSVSSEGLRFNVYAPIQTCLMFAPRLGWTGDLFTYICTARYQTLCQLHQTQ